MLRRTLQELAASQGKPIRLRVLAINTGARRFYERFGFVVASSTPERVFMEYGGEGPTTLGSDMKMTREISEKFAVQWAEAWNARNIEAVLEHFHEDVVFISPTALAIVASPVVRGKDALRAYWTKALARITSLRFTVDHVLWDPVRRELAIVYTSDTDGTSKRVSENLTFNEHGKVVAAEVFHGVPSAAPVPIPGGQRVERSTR